MRTRALCLLLSLAACSGGTDDSSPPDGGSSPRDGGARDGGEPVPGEAILARTATRTHDCSGTIGAMAEVGEIGGHDFVGLGPNDAYAFRLASMPSTTWDPDAPKWLEIAALGSDGTRATPQVVPAGEGPRRALAVGALGDAILAVWQESSTLRAAVVETDGTLRAGPRTIASTGDWIGAVTVLPHPSGALVVWPEQSSPGANGVGRLFGVVVDADGAAEAAPLTILERQTGFGWLAPTVVRSAGGFAFAFAASDADGGAVWFGRFDDAGALVGAPRMITSTASRYLGFAPDRVALYARGDGFVAAWAVVKPTESWDEKTWSMVQVARLDVDGAIVDGPYDLDAPVDDIDVVEPALFAFGDALALSWATGDHIYVCGGCIPNHDVHLVLLDPERLAPVSDVATIDGAVHGGGLLRRRHVVTNDHVAVSFDVTFHVWDRYGEGVLSCVER